MKTTIIASAALALFAAPVAAQGVISEINGLTAGLNGQINLGDVQSELDVAIDEAGEASATAAAIGNAVGARGVPSHTNHQPAVVTPVGGPPVLAIGHQLPEVLLERFDIEGLERLAIV